MNRNESSMNKEKERLKMEKVSGNKIADLNNVFWAMIFSEPMEKLMKSYFHREKTRHKQNIITNVVTYAISAFGKYNFETEFAFRSMAAAVAEPTNTLTRKWITFSNIKQFILNEDILKV